MYVYKHKIKKITETDKCMRDYIEMKSKKSRSKHFSFIFATSINNIKMNENT